jgi:peptidoglycan-N-acetylglucosamine deacetylase
MLKNKHILLAGLALYAGFGLVSGWLMAFFPTLILLGCGIAIQVFSIQHTLFIRTLCRIRTSEKEVFLSFDDGPSGEYTPLILETLSRHGLKAVFFCTGERAEHHPELLKRIADAGHFIGNHTYSHDWRNAFRPARIAEAEIRRTSDAFRRITGKETRLFRPPFGITTPLIATAIKSRGLITVGWDIRSLDTVIRDPERLLRRICRKLRPGSIILMHDNREITARILDELIGRIQKQGYKIVLLPEQEIV